MARRRTLSRGNPDAPDRDDAPATHDPALGARLRATRRGGRGRRPSRRPPALPLPAREHPVISRAPARSRPLPRPARALDDDPGPPQTTHRIWVPGTDAGPGTMVLLPDARVSLLARALRLVVLLGFFLAGGVLATAAFPWLETTFDRAVEGVRSVTEAGFLHSEPTAASEPAVAAETPAGAVPGAVPP